ncbi:MAG: bifunctional adenosylcobinamide kinase/adenosylcobinamide-phosphate guanylyltransferase [Ilumatobacter sp.]|uniref:bifunctional adenosylcobinamide kinase/adenosylcobinamide-phosphate guanylyltransferase n=1 Tax=Ilumatobacter sp. TaxID=1967498 RepID=UPI00391B7372
MSLTLLIGGARSGKSSLAVDIGHRHHAAGDAVTYLATAPAVDDDMEQRIERHRSERPTTWATIEEQHDLAAAVESVPSGLVIIDCLTLWTSNLMWDGLDDDAIRSVASTTAAQCAQRRDPVVVITNEVGLGVHPDTELGRRYRDTLGWVNQTWAAAAGTALLLVAGKAIPLHDPLETLGR